MQKFKPAIHTNNIGGGFAPKLFGQRFIAEAPPADGSAQVSISPDALGGAIAKAVNAAVDAAFKAREGKGPAVHTDDRRNSKSYVDDAAREMVGQERMERRAETERRVDEGTAHHFSPTAMRLRESGRRSVKDGAGLLASEFLGFLGVSKGDPERALKLAKSRNASRAVIKALGESELGSGGALVPEDVAADVIELLYNASVFLAAGPTPMTITSGNMTLPGLATGAQGGWVGESQNAPYSEAGFRQVKIDLKKLAVLSAAANEFLRDARGNAVEIVRQDLIMNAGVMVDAAGLRSLGTEHTPTGLRGQVAAAHKFDSAGTTIPNISTDAMKMLRFLEDAKIMAQRPAWFSSPRTKYGLMGARDGNNNEVWAKELRGGTWYGIPFFSTQNIPTNVGGGGTKSELYLVAMEHEIAATEPGGMRVDIADGAAYHNGVEVVSGFSRDESIVRLTTRMDFVSRHNGRNIVMMEECAIA